VTTDLNASQWGDVDRTIDPAMRSTTKLLSALVRINSVNPSLIPGAPGETEIARFVKHWLDERGIATEIHDAAPHRPSVIATVPGKGGGRSLLLYAHLDTVGVAGMSDPFNPRIVDGRMYGRGTYDMKASLAACMLAMCDLRPRELAGDVLLAAVADEEHASLGVQDVLPRIRADAAIVTEPTSLQVCIAHKGFSWHDIVTSGRAAHGSQPQSGIDAIVHMGRVLNRLEALQAELHERTPHPLLGHGSLHASLISGGQELSSYPASCRLQLERRTLPEEDIAVVEQEIDGLLIALAAEDPQFQARHQTSLFRPPFSVDPDEAIVQTLFREASSVLGTTPATFGASFWMDAAFLAAAGIPTVAFGPHGAGAHGIDEWVDLHSVDQCRAILGQTIRSFSGTAVTPPCGVI
jgi:acetylornithine deacetylase